jgi:hypothetical protein
MVIASAAIVPALFARELKLVVEIEERVYSYESANNGAGPMWCAGSTSLVRTGDRVFATALETLPDLKPLNNCRWTLLERTSDGWVQRHKDKGRTREPSPMAVFDDGSVFVSGNPTTTPPDTYGGPAKPELWRFSATDSLKAERHFPKWEGSPQFSEHSYRSLAADSEKGELVLLQNVGYTHADWAFRDASGNWSAQGKLEWPLGSEYEKPKPIRLCYPNVALKNRAVHFFGVGDIAEPVPAWQQHKKELTGKEWDYVFRRLYYTWTPDIESEPLSNWIEIAIRDETAGHLWPCDLWIAPDHTVHILWTERALDDRLREKFFPDAEQSNSLNYSILRNGKPFLKKPLFESKNAAEVPARARFHVTKDGRLFVVTAEGHRNRIVEILKDQSLGQSQELPLKKAFSNFFTTTPRAGSPASDTLELLGTQVGTGNTMSYARIRLSSPSGH